jgi:hypothetical protein
MLLPLENRLGSSAALVASGTAGKIWPLMEPSSARSFQPGNPGREL